MYGPGKVLKATFHSAIFENPVHPAYGHQIMPTKKRVMRSRYTLIFTPQKQQSFKTR